MRPIIQPSAPHALTLPPTCSHRPCPRPPGICQLRRARGRKGDAVPWADELWHHFSVADCAGPSGLHHAWSCKPAPPACPTEWATASTCTALRRGTSWSLVGWTSPTPRVARHTQMVSACAVQAWRSSTCVRSSASFQQAIRPVAHHHQAGCPPTHCVQVMCCCTPSRTRCSVRCASQTLVREDARGRFLHLERRV